MVSATGAGNSSTYAYDGRGWRKSRTVNGTATISVTDTDNREVLEYDGGSGAILRWYAYDLGANGVLGQMNVPGGTRSAFAPDIQGSIIGTFNSAGALARSAYLAYGASAAAASPFGYTGQRSELQAGGIYFYRARHYSPRLGRFLQIDPSGHESGINLYAYVENDPLNRVDPLGLASQQNAHPSNPSIQESQYRPPQPNPVPYPHPAEQPSEQILGALIGFGTGVVTGAVAGGIAASLFTPLAIPFGAVVGGTLGGVGGAIWGYQGFPFP